MMKDNYKNNLFQTYDPNEIAYRNKKNKELSFRYFDKQERVSLTHSIGGGSVSHNSSNCYGMAYFDLQLNNEVLSFTEKRLIPVGEPVESVKAAYRFYRNLRWHFQLSSNGIDEFYFITPK